MEGVRYGETKVWKWYFRCIFNDLGHICEQGWAMSLPKGLRIRWAKGLMKQHLNPYSVAHCRAYIAMLVALWSFCQTKNRFNLITIPKLAPWSTQYGETKSTRTRQSCPRECYIVTNSGTLCQMQIKRQCLRQTDGQPDIDRQKNRHRHSLKLSCH